MPDYAMQFETVLKNYLPVDGVITFSTYWGNDFARTSLLYTALLMQYDRTSSGQDGDIINDFLEEIEKENAHLSVKLAIEIVEFLKLHN